MLVGVKNRGISCWLQTKKKQETALFAYLIGPASEVGRLIQEVCGINSEVYCKFLYSFLMSCQFRMGVAALNKNKSIEKEFLQKNNKYNSIWRKINEADQIKSGEREEPLWVALKKIFNTAAKRLFMLEDREFFYTIALDDDKVHFKWK